MRLMNLGTNISECSLSYEGGYAGYGLLSVNCGLWRINGHLLSADRFIKDEVAL
jgi:hypothetical protein